METDGLSPMKGAEFAKDLCNGMRGELAFNYSHFTAKLLERARGQSSSPATILLMWGLHVHGTRPVFRALACDSQWRLAGVVRFIQFIDASELVSLARSLSQVLSTPPLTGPWPALILYVVSLAMAERCR